MLLFLPLYWCLLADDLFAHTRTRLLARSHIHLHHLFYYIGFSYAFCTMIMRVSEKKKKQKTRNKKEKVWLVANKVLVCVCTSLMWVMNLACAPVLFSSSFCPTSSILSLWIENVNGTHIQRIVGGLTLHHLHISLCS